MGRHGAFQLSGEGQASTHCGVAPQRSASEPVTTASDVLTGAACAQRRVAGRWHVPVHGGERCGQLTGSHKTPYCPDRYNTSLKNNNKVYIISFNYLIITIFVFYCPFIYTTTISNKNNDC